MNPTLLIVDDEKNTRDGLKRALEERYDVYTAEDGQAAAEMIEKENFDAVLADIRMPRLDGLELLSRAKKLSRPPIVIVMTAYGTEETAVEAMRRGADDYINKGKLDLDDLERRVALALKNRRLVSENFSPQRTADKKFGMGNIIGESAAMREVFETIQQVAPTTANVLIEGETGTGKELVARAIHQLSPRKNGPFIPVHCAALPTTLLESELFGHERGAFTDAKERRIGRFEMADGGTLFLDEVGEIEPAIQVKLLRALEERAFERLGGQKTIHVDVRLVTATNKQLQQLVSEKKFRDDLYFRLNVVTITLPPVRERSRDIPLLVKAFLDEFNRANKKKVGELAPDVLDALINYPWPGNVRELRNCVERMVVLARGTKVSIADLPPNIRNPQPVAAGVDRGEPPSARAATTIEEMKKQAVVSTLRECGGNRTAAAERLGISRRTLHRKLKEYGLEEL